MESRRSLHQLSDGKGGLVPIDRAAAVHRIPLLPYERELIATLGCSEDEYRQFVRYALARSGIRPAEYDSIPDVKAEVVTAIVSIVIGLAAQAAAYFLTPKPKQVQPQRQREAGRISQQLASLTGADRFSATFGFDSQAELANYGDPIPLIFGRYTGTSGGILAAPRLVWSRAFALGSQQAVKMLMVVGEQGLGQGIESPDLNGIFLGNTPLDAIYNHDFAFYWKRNTNDYFRIKAQNLLYGTRGSKSAGDIETQDDIFACPTINSLTDTGFCHSYTPSANTVFGVFAPIPNGTDYRVNWQLVSIPHTPNVNGNLTNKPNYRDDPKGQKVFDRIKIAGDYDIIRTRGGDGILDLRAIGQVGIGRGYGRGMGITDLNGNGVPIGGGALFGQREVRQARVGDTIIFTIGGNVIPEDEYYIYDKDGTIYKNTQVADINSEVNAGRRAADDALQIGETIMIGRTVWVVESRALQQWTEGARQSIGLRCVEIFGEGIGSSIGLVSERFITRVIFSDDLGTTNNRNALGLHAGPSYYPLTKVAFGLVRNTRECEVTEIGIRSQVWNRANGLCNFSGLPSEVAFRQAEVNGVSVQSGTMTLYLKRTSAWTIWLRPSGTDPSGNEYKWQPLGERFCVTGETPQDQFNFIRITHPSRGRYEFRFIPKSGADVVRHSPETESYWQLNAKNGQPLARQCPTPYGTFTVYSQGQYVARKDVSFNPELISESQIVQPARQATTPSTLEVESYLPDIQGGGVQATEVQLTETPWLPNNGPGNKAATLVELFGRPVQFGLTASATREFVLPGTGKRITIKFDGVVNEYFPQTHPFFPGWRTWNLSSISVVSSTGGFNILETFDAVIPVQRADNDRATPYGLTSVGMKLRVSKTSGTEPRGIKQAFAHDTLGDASSFGVGTKRNYVFDATDGTNILKVVMTGTVVSAPERLRKDFPGITNAWDFLQFVPAAEGTTGAWGVGQNAYFTTPSSTNSPYASALSQPNERVGVSMRVQSVQTTLIPAQVTAPRFFEENSQLTDVSFYNGLLAKSNESGPEHEITYVNEFTSNPDIPNYEDMTIAGLSLKASRNFTSLNQLRIWLKDGISVKRFNGDGTTGVNVSNRFSDLVYHLLTDKTAGAGNVISPELIDTDSLHHTARFLDANKLTFDGAIDQTINIRNFVSEIAPFFLCNFTIKNGRFGLTPALPTDTAGQIANTPVPIKQLFTSGNIIEDSFSVEYLSTEERKNFQALMRYRSERQNQLPEEQTLVVRWKDLPETATIESFDMTQYCTTRNHAFMVARYFLSLRRRVTHTIRFRTTPYGINLAPGDYIRVITQASPYSSANNGVVGEDGSITAVTDLPDGRYEIYYWTADFDSPLTDTMTVADGKSVEPRFNGAIFTVVNASVSSSTYVVEQLTLSEEGLVDIVALHFPTTEALNSIMALDVNNPEAFATEG